MRTLTDAEAAELCASGRVRVTWRDDSLPHQIRIFLLGSTTGKIAISCTCRKKPGGSFEPLEARTLWQPHEPMEIWRAHMSELEAAS